MENLVELKREDLSSTNGGGVWWIVAGVAIVGHYLEETIANPVASASAFREGFDSVVN